MYNAQVIKERLKEQQKVKGIKNADDMMEELDLGVNIIRQMSDKKGVGCFALAKIADYLDCSVDYLLGRVDTPSSTYSINNQNATVTGTQNNVINGNVHSSPEIKNETTTDTELVKLIQSLPLVERAEAILYLNKLKEK